MYQVINKTTGNKFKVNKDNILNSALKEGLFLPYGCQKGLCGKCKAFIVSGEVSNITPNNAITKEEIDNNITLLCQCYAKSDLEIEIQELATRIPPSSKKNMKIKEINALNYDVFELVLEQSKENKISFLAGQYANLSYKKYIDRPFSIANTPNDDFISFHIKVVKGGGFTNLLANDLKIGENIEIEGPKGSFYFNEQSTNPIIMVAGGTGLGPIKAIIEYIIKHQLKRKITLYWGVNTQDDFYLDIPKEWLEKITFIPVLSNPKKNWHGRIGFVHQAVLDDISDLSNYDIYVCGAPIMVKTANETFIEKGLKIENFFSDSFEINTK
ncbi:CDP-6-deoxy-delta-3,4-glucoseen reductase-like [hydrothermal vent metagenome]|uniref:CDP-6-deoxy-delta-3,4-glucoseen reductase-like n=1 Tax=hydrothermal vent metagenome TaxID=652676 RepID=A0A1W1CBW6_9ZZZZ